ncbi:MAG: sugar-binding domain-containing protein [Bacillota bacterium]|nr:sugar-binding domain-containing protein [Bacillota bacterium]
MSLLSQLVPEMHELMPIRLSIMKAIQRQQPVGRRQLASLTGLSERDIRRECEILRESGVLEFLSQGMTLLPDGERILRLLGSQSNSALEMQEALKHQLGIRRVIVVRDAGDALKTLTEIGKSAATRLRTLVRETGATVIGLTGGHSIERVVAGYKENNVALPGERLVVSARGGLGHSYEMQANTLVERLASKMDAQYVTLLSQDNLSAESIERLKQEPAIKRALEQIHRIDVLVFGIGRADVMANRRELEPAQIDSILAKGAVAEAFGYYFDEEGNIVHEISTIGIDLSTYQSLPHAIAVAGGKEKADAIRAVATLNPNMELITDETAAQEILNKIKGLRKAE